MSLASGEVWTPAIAAEGDQVIVAYIDMSEGPSRVTLREISDGGERFSDAAPLERLAEGAYNPRQNQWSPSVSLRAGRAAIAFIDFRSFTWEVHGAFREAGAEAFSDVIRLDDAVDAAEPIHSDPTITLLEGGAALLAHTDLRVRREDYDPRVRLFSFADGGGIDEANESLSLASSDADGWSQWRPVIEASGATIYAAFQDFRGGLNHIRFAISEDGGAHFSEDRALISGAEADAFSPIFLAGVGGSAPSIVFEATGSGRRQLALSALPH